MRRKFKKRALRYFSFFMVLNILAEIASPTVAMALTNGTLQPEFTGFEPANSSEMVDLFTGDFKYNIPLLDVDGYPLNLSYHAGPNMEQEASWVGLGWSLNPGVLNRNVRGVPDDFKGEVMQSKTNIRPNLSGSVGFHNSTWFQSDFEFQNGAIGGKIGLNVGAALNYNNYKGYGLEVDVDGHLSLTKKMGPAQVTMGGGVGMSLNSQDGGTLSYNHSNGVGVNVGNEQVQVGLSASYTSGGSINTRTGAMTKTYGASVNASAKVGLTTFALGFSTSHSVPMGPVSYSPRITNDFESSGFCNSIKGGLWGSIKPYVNMYPLPLEADGGLMLGFKFTNGSNKLRSQTKNLGSYGYMYSELAPYNALMDYNSFREGMIMQETPNINFSNHTYDVFSATAQGMGSNFRTFRSDVGVLHDPVGTNKGVNKNAQLEVSAGAWLHLLVEGGLTVSTTKSGKWDTQLLTSIPFVKKDINQSSSRFFEKYYFKEMGAISARDAAYESSIGGEAPLAPILVKSGPDFNAMSPIATLGRSTRDVRDTYIQSLTGHEASEYGVERKYNLYAAPIASTQVIDLNKGMVVPTTTAISRMNKGAIDVSHHISEVSLTNNAGNRYTYGIPVYNLEKKRVMFNASDRVYDDYSLNEFFPTQSFSNSPMPISKKYQMVSYDPTGDDINDNRRGLDNFYQHDITPMYATSYLLTSIVSQDYVDITGDGPSYDDLGSFTKFNYYKGEDYGWREPFCFPGNEANTNPDWDSQNLPDSKNQANYEKGLVADDFDDKAFYEWGKRETYYANSIETKNYVVFFETSGRLDGLGVTTEHGDFGTPKLLKLDAIKLYSKHAIAANGGTVTGIAPIKTVHFVYDYTLCPGTFNSSNNANDDNLDLGKLTLKKVYFSYGRSEKSALSPYEFTYDNNFNFAYDPRAIDRWGSCKTNTLVDVVGSTGSILNTTEFPYAEQDKILADKYAAAWCLTGIKTPSGSKIDITYESDDYGYVQNEQAGQMLKLTMVKDVVSPSDDASIYSGNPNIKNANYIVIDLENFHERGISATTYSTLSLANSFAVRNVIKLNKQLYYKTFMHLAGPLNCFGAKKHYWDFVSGYAEVEDVGVYTSTIPGNTYTANIDNATHTFYKYAYVKLKKEVAFKSQDVFPITIAGWDFMRNFLPRVAYPGSELDNMSDQSQKPIKQFKNMLVGLGVALADFVNGLGGSPNKRFYTQNFCAKLNYSKSFVRAYVPLKKKMGGGHRVKKIVTDDSWDLMATAEAKTTYGQTYDYTTMEGKHKISSGVATYEPFVGGDEISLRQPMDFEIEKKFAPNDHFYQETPYAESMYPSPQVGYGKVTVTPLPDPGNMSNPDYCKIGKTVYEFYTAKNFPVIYLTTGVDKKPNESSLLEEFISVKKSFKMLAAAQGHVIKLNDMHGKLKAIAAFAEDNLLAPISEVRYYYKQASAAKDASTQLVTRALTINENNQIATTSMSRDIDLSVDVKESITESETFGNRFLLEIGMKVFNWVYPCPSPPTFCWSVTTGAFVKTLSNETISGAQKFGINTSTMTKVIQQYGILEKIESFDNKSKTTLENLLWDKYTGEVLLTKETNELNQSVYNFNYQAYWPYPQMGHEFRRDNIQLLCPATSSNPVWDGVTGILTPSVISNEKLIMHGDEVRLYQVDSDGVPVYNVTNAVDNRFWAISSYTNTADEMYLLDKNGVIVSSSTFSIDPNEDYMIKIVEPVNKNNTSAKAGYVTSKSSPISSNAISITSTLGILDAGVQEFCTSNSIYLNRTISNQSLTSAASNYSTTTFNQIITGYYGTFRPSSIYKYNVNRSYSSSQPNMKSDGYYVDFSPYWDYTTKWAKVASDYKWIRMNENRFYSPHGELMESQNSVMVPTSNRLSFNHTLPALTAYNARVDEVAFDSFEDYGIYTALATSTTNFNYNDYLGMHAQLTSTSGAPPVLVGTVAHTGRTSLYFAPTKTVTLHHDYLKSLQLPEYSSDDFMGCAPYILNCSNLNFRNGKYLVSMWVKGVTPATTFTNLVDFKINEIHSTGAMPTITSTISTITPVYQSPIINGWQKIDYQVAFTYTIPGPPTIYNYSNVEFIISSGASTAFYMDDFRIQPYNASMVCNVYDPLHLRLWAQLDDRNYATLIEYDSEGMVVRKKKETGEGIYTISETRKGIVK